MHSMFEPLPSQEIQIFIPALFGWGQRLHVTEEITLPVQDLLSRGHHWFCIKWILPEGVPAQKCFMQQMESIKICLQDIKA